VLQRVCAQVAKHAENISNIGCLQIGSPVAHTHEVRWLQMTEPELQIGWRVSGPRPGPEGLEKEVMA
jgi:hypothetical protein